jgi:hypothetical protein
MKLAAILVFLVGIIVLASAQPVVISGDPGYNADSPYNRLYDTKTVITIKGKVSGVQIAPPMAGMGNAVTIIVKTKEGKNWQVDVGPEWFINNQKTQIKMKDTVQVTGSRVTIGGHDLILAEQVVKNKSVLALRRPMGRPYWDAVTADTPPIDKNHMIAGEITAIDSFVDGTNGLTERLKIHTEEGDFLVALGPEWFMKRQALQMSLGDRVDINAFAPVGNPSQPVGQGLAAPPVIFATSVGFGQQWMVLRSVNGRPMWYAIDGG